jgi:hypothetical protein
MECSCDKQRPEQEGRCHKLLNDWVKEGRLTDLAARLREGGAARS